MKLTEDELSPRPSVLHLMTEKPDIKEQLKDSIRLQWLEKSIFLHLEQIAEIQTWIDKEVNEILEIRKKHAVK